MTRYGEAGQSMTRGLEGGDHDCWRDRSVQVGPGPEEENAVSSRARCRHYKYVFISHRCHLPSIYCSFTLHTLPPQTSACCARWQPGGPWQGSLQPGGMDSVSCKMCNVQCAMCCAHDPGSLIPYVCLEELEARPGVGRVGSTGLYSS